MISAHCGDNELAPRLSTAIYELFTNKRHVGNGKSRDAGEYVTNSNAKLTSNSMLRGYDKIELAEKRDAPMRTAERRMIDWRFAVLASLALWAAIVILGVILFG